LNLDQVVESITANRADYDLKPFFFTPLHDVEAVQYRHAVLRDLEKDAVFEAVRAFAQQMRSMREQLAQADKLHYQYQKGRWFLDAVGIYCHAVCALGEELAAQDLESSGLLGFREYLAGYLRSDAFSALASQTQALDDALARVRYSIHIKGSRVRVDGYQELPDYSQEVERIFAKFRQGAVQDYRARLPNWLDMNHVEAQVLDLVAQLHPDVFGTLDDYCARHRGYLDPKVGAFDREVQFYVVYLEFMERFKPAGLPFCYPRVSSESKKIHALQAFDIALANKLASETGSVVCNDFALEGSERILVVTGSNQGGKTAFARMFGQLHYLASLGCPVPGQEAALFLPDRVFTHFEKEEDLATLRGKLEDELVRIRQILGRATTSSFVVMNESFTSTTLNDALVLGTEVISRLVDLGLLGVYVTFVDELASLGPGTVSMVGTVVPDNPAMRTYKIVRRPADGQAIQAQKRIWRSFLSSPDSVLDWSVQVLELLVGALRRLRAVADEHAGSFHSEGFARFFAMLHQELDDEYLATVEGISRSSSSGVACCSAPSSARATKASATCSGKLPSPGAGCSGSRWPTGPG
jgi:DNA mismatch repair protein MutS